VRSLAWDAHTTEVGQANNMMMGQLVPNLTKIRQSIHPEARIMEQLAFRTRHCLDILPRIRRSLISLNHRSIHAIFPTRSPITMSRPPTSTVRPAHLPIARHLRTTIPRGSPTTLARTTIRTRTRRRDYRTRTRSGRQVMTAEHPQVGSLRLSIPSTTAHILMQDNTRPMTLPLTRSGATRL
jgi:hypothetical protein